MTPRRGRRTARLVIRHRRGNPFRRDSVEKEWDILLDGKQVGWIVRNQDDNGVERPVKVSWWGDLAGKYCESVVAAKRKVRAHFAVGRGR